VLALPGGIPLSAALATYAKKNKMQVESEIYEKKLRILDFDDTLVKTDAEVKLIRRDGSTIQLSPAEFAVYKPKPDDSFDFSDFETDLKNPKAIKQIVTHFQRMVAKASTGRSRVEILTARPTAKPIDNWLEDMGIKKIPVKALGSSDPYDKAAYIERRINDGFTDIVFFDDSLKNIRAVNTLKKKYPNVKLVTKHVKL
jgi:hypothetical protein